MRGKEKGSKEAGAKETGGKDTERKDTGAIASGAQCSQETGGKGDILTGERERDNMLPGDMTYGTECDGRDPTQELL